MAGLLNSIGHAARGVIYVLKFERNARIHLVAAIMVASIGWFVGVTSYEMAALYFAVMMVFLSEIFNSAFEKTLDIIDISHNPKIKVVKDMAAAAVLLTAAGAMLVGIVIFWPHLEVLWVK